MELFYSFPPDIPIDEWSRVCVAISNCGNFY